MNHDTHVTHYIVQLITYMYNYATFHTETDWATLQPWYIRKLLDRSDYYRNTIVWC